MNELSVIEGLFRKMSDNIQNLDFQDGYKIRTQAFTRYRKLSFEKVVLFILGLPQKSLPTAIDEFLEHYVGSKKDKKLFTKQAFSLARQQISPDCFTQLLTETVTYIEENQTNLKEWNGYRLMAIDGVKVQVPNTTENKETFGVNKNATTVINNDVAMSGATALFDVTNDLIINAVLEKRYTSERDQAIRLMENSPIELFNDKTILLFDRGYPSCHMYNYFYQRKGYFLMRVMNVTLKNITALPLGDHIIDYNAGLSGIKKLRVIKFMLDENMHETLVTNVLDETLTITKMKELYFMRWGVESKYKELKSILKIENFSGIKSIAVKQEFYATLVISNIVALVKIHIDRELKKDERIKARRRDYQTNRSYLIGIILKNLVSLLLCVNRRKLIKKIIKKAKEKLSMIRPGRSFARIKSKSKSRINYTSARRTSL